MIANLGFGALVITFLISLYGIAAAVYGVRKQSPAWVDSARNAMLLTWPLVSLAALSIIYLLVTEHFEVEYVAQVTSSSMPLYLRVTALWGGQSGSLVFWAWLMSAFASAVTLRKWERDREFLPWVIVVALVTLAFFLGLPKPIPTFVAERSRHGNHVDDPASQLHPLHPTRRQRSQPLTASPRHDHPPTHALPRFRFIRYPV
jgi:hypothetical protein